MQDLAELLVVQDAKRLFVKSSGKTVLVPWLLCGVQLHADVSVWSLVYQAFAKRPAGFRKKITNHFIET